MTSLVANTAEAPTPDDMRHAADWLEMNEGDPDERGPLLVVADWLKARADAVELRAECRKAGIPVAHVRAALAARQVKP